MVLVLRPIDAGQSRYYLEGSAPGRWIGAGLGAMGLRGTVDAASLPAVLAGNRPDGAPLPVRHSPSRRSGFDLILAAPKSVSLLAALSHDERRAPFLRAREQAVEETVGYLERHATWTRRGAADTRIPTTGLIAAAFHHSTSAAGDPHLHTHLIVANVVQGDDGRWSALDSRALYRHSRAAGAVFQAALRHHLAEQGLAFEWQVNRHGLGDIVGVSRAAIDAASRRHQQVTAALDPGLAGPVEKAIAAGRTRRASMTGPDSPGTTGQGSADTGSDERWRARVAVVGLDRDAAERLIARAGTRTGPHLSGPDGVSLEYLLSQQYSRFRHPDVVQAAAVLAPSGATAASLEAVADEFLKTALPAGGDTWTTAGLRRLEDRIVTVAAPRDGPAVGLVAPGTPPPAGIGEAGQRAFERLTQGGAPVDLVRGDLIGQAQMLDAARRAWEASGHRVALVSPTERGQARWRALAGLEPPQRSPNQPTVVLVDNAERWPTADLHHVMSDAAARHAKVVLLDGGTSPRRRQPVSPAMETLRTTMVAVDTGPGPHLHSQAEPPPPVVAAGRDGSVILAPTGRSAMDHLVREWQRQRTAGEPPGRQPRMVALGPAEAEHLNAMARDLRVQAGEVHGPAVDIGGRRFQAGDEVAALRKDPRLGSVPGGTVGRVTAVDADLGRATIEWPGRDQALCRAGAAPLTHSYATTPSYLRHRHDGPVLSLGNVEALAPRLHPDRVYAVVPTPSPSPGRDLLDPVATLRAELPGRSAIDATRDAGRTLAELASERDRLAERLLATVPPDARPQLRRVTEQRECLAANPYALNRAAALATLDAHGAVLATAVRDRGDWLEGHRDQLDRWDELSQAMTWRATALGRGAEIRPTVAVLAELGPPPADGTPQPVWRRAAQAVEAHRERWGLADRPLEMAPVAGPDHDRVRRADELRVLATTQELRRTRSPEHYLAPGGL
jgi:conjugative relaxase-like TrwC/TraI family protein